MPSDTPLHEDYAKLRELNRAYVAKNIERSGPQFKPGHWIDQHQWVPICTAIAEDAIAWHVFRVLCDRLLLSSFDDAEIHPCSDCIQMQFANRTWEEPNTPRGIIRLALAYEEGKHEQQ